VSLRGLLVLIGLLAAAIVVLVRVGTHPGTAAQAPADAALVRAFTESEVHAIELDCGGAPVALARTSAAGWRLAKPFEAEADPRKVHEVISALQDARAHKVVAEKADDVASFGLAPAACTVKVDLGSAEPAMTLRLGRTSPVGTERYAAAADGKVVLTDGALFGTVSRGADAFRERRLIPVAGDEMTRIVLSRPDGRLALSKIGEAWQVESPRRDAASLNACTNLARAIAALEAADAGPVELPRDPRPDRRIEIRVAARGIDRPLVAFVAAAGVSGQRLAWREGAGNAGLVAESAAEELQRGADSYFETRIATFSLPDVRSVSLARGGTTVELARAGEGAPWTGREGASTFKVEGTRVIDFLNKIRSLTASGFEPSPPAAPPTGQITVRSERGDLARLTYGPLGSGSQWVTTPVRQGAVFRVEQASLGTVPGRSELAQP
jgi:hypothetical protein